MPRVKSQAERDADWAVMREWFPDGTKLTVIDTTRDGRIIVRWKLDSDPCMTNEAALRIGGHCFKERAKP